MHAEVRHYGGHPDSIIGELLDQLASDSGAQVEELRRQRSVIQEQTTRIVLHARADEILRAKATGIVGWGLEVAHTNLLRTGGV